MRDDLAERVLAHVMSWDPAQITQFGACLQDLARYKYDEYEGFGPGEKFVESLAAWLWQLEPGERADAIQFVLTSLVFVSRLELDHVIGTVYPDVIRPILIQRAAEELSLPPYKVARIAASREFRELERKTLVLGLADGSRLDRLRRASPQLSHEQVYLAPEIGEDTRRSMRQKLTEALQKLDLNGPAEFRQVMLVDDFALPIRFINFPFPEFQVAYRAQSLTLAVAEYPPGPLTGVSADAAFPLRRHAG